MTTMARLVCRQAGDSPAGTIGDTGARTIAGLAVPWHTTMTRFGVALQFTPDTLKLPDDLSTVKLLVQHDDERPVGYATAAAADDDGLRVTFTLPDHPRGDAVLAEVDALLRDGLSVGVELDDDTFDAIWAAMWDEPDGPIDAAGTLREVSLVSIPQFNDARVGAAAVLTASATEGNPAMPDANTLPVPAPAAPAPAPATVDPPAAPTHSAPPVAAGVNAARSSGRLDLAGAMRLVASLGRGDGDLRSVMAALTDIVPGDDAGEGLLRPTWLGELWQAVYARRDLIDMIGPPRPLTTGTKVYGWQWVERPGVDDYEGNKTDVPSFPASTKAIEAPVDRIAGANDIDRIYFDLGDPGFLESYFRMMAESYALKSEAYVASKFVAAATVPDDTVTSVLQGLDAAARALEMVGASLDYCAVSADLWADLLTIKASDAPWLLGTRESGNLPTSTASIGGIRFSAEHALPANTMIAGDRRAATFYEASPPFRVQALNIPNGGIDLGLFGYLALLVNDPNAIVKITVADAAPAVTATAAKKTTAK